MNTKKFGRTRRKARVRKTVFGTDSRPRMSVFKSNKYVYVQIINDDKGKTLMTMSTKSVDKKVSGTATNQKIAFALGEKTAEMAMKKKIKNVVFDRNGYQYHGRVKAVADGARKGGLIF